MKAQWAISTETITLESSEDGEAASRDYSEPVFIKDYSEPVFSSALSYMDGLSFREAMDTFHWADSQGGVEANCYPLSRDYPPDWFTAYGAMDYRTGEIVNTSLHVPRHVTPSSRIRIARLLRVHGT